MRSGQPPIPPRPTALPCLRQTSITCRNAAWIRRVVHLSGDSHLDAEVVGADEQHVHAVHGGDGVGRVQAGLGLDHGDHHGCRVEFTDGLVGGAGRGNAIVELHRQASAHPSGACLTARTAASASSADCTPGTMIPSRRSP